MDVTPELQARATELLTAYTNRAPALVLIYPDPGMVGTVAVRAMWEVPLRFGMRRERAGFVADFILENMHRTRLLAEALRQDVHEVEFFTWPPQQRH